MSEFSDFKTKSFLTNLELIVRKDPTGCIAVLYNDEKNVIICQGMQADLLYWFSQRFTPQSYDDVFNEISSLYEVDEETLHKDLEAVLRRMIEIKVISLC